MSVRGRRRFLRGLAAGIAASPALVGRSGLFGAAPAIVPAPGARPSITHGVASGDVDGSRAMVWSRANRDARMIVEWATTESFREYATVRGSTTSSGTGFTAKTELRALPTGQTIFYRVRFEAERGVSSEPVAGRFRTASKDPSDVFFAWSADTAGQGWGISPQWGGMRLYETMRQARPDLFIHCGDTIYADGPIEPEVRLDDGSMWRNVVTEAKSKVAESLDEFRGNHLYNLQDVNVQRFNAEVPVLALWDDHEVRNNWYPGQLIDDPRYTERRADLLASRASQAFHEHFPIRMPARDGARVHRAHAWGPLVDVFALDMRTYRGPNTANRQGAAGAETAFLGARQVSWLKERLKASRATWKIVAAGMPIGLVVPDGETRFEAVANGDGPALGRELEIADLLRFIARERVANVVWITGDVHYCAAHHYHPDRAVFREFAPFWEFVAGPIHAGTFGPAKLDNTFGPEARFIGIPGGMKPNRPPSEGLQFFGGLRLDARSRVLTVTLHSLAGEIIYTQPLEPDRPRS